MAAGTTVSRASGFVRSILLAAALGNALHADLFTIANTIPNMLYILLAGGVFNAVLVPQLVRAMRNDEDRGDAYTSRVITLAGLFLGGVTVLLVVFAPQVMQLYLDSSYDDPALAAEKESVVDLARLCLPQVFFYGMFVLVGQVLNARGRFGPMMWAPIANNLVSMAVLVLYIVVFGTRATGAYSPGEELLLGLGSTLGIALQFAILLPFLRAAGFRYVPRFDFRDTGLGHTLRLASWTLGFVVVNQVAYTVVVRLASGGTADAAVEGTGYTIYSSTFLLVMVPHSVVTVSLATAVLPRLSASAAEDRLSDLGATLAAVLRTTLVLVVPFAAVLPLVATEVSSLVWGYGAAEATYENYALSLALFAPGVLFFTVHYLMLRGFYALERTRTVFWIQCVIAAVNVSVAVVLVTRTGPELTSPMLVVAYAVAYAVGSALSYLVLRRALGGLQTDRLAGLLGRVLPVAAVAALVTWAVHRWLTSVGTPGPAKVEDLLLVVVAGGTGAAVFLAVARLLRVDEVRELTGLVTRRLPRPGRR